MTSLSSRLLCRAIAIALPAVIAMASPLVAQPPREPVTLVRPTTAADSLIEERTRRLAAQLRCPVCQGLSLQDSPSELSLQMRDVVRGQVAAGKSDAEVKAFFVARYGEWILMEPPARGFNLLVYALPLIWLGVGVAVLTVMVRRWTRAAPPDAATLPAEGD